MKTIEQPDEMAATLYETVAARITHLIDQGTFRTGDRLPSVRRLSRQMQVSLTTVLEAYRLLEDRGRIEARPQSGHYVCTPRSALPAEPEMSRPAPVATDVSTGELVLQLMRDAQNPALVPFGAAVPNVALLPTARLNRLVAAVARRAGAAGNAYAPPPGCEPLRVQVARRLVTAGCALTPEQIVVTSGCQEALALGLRATCRPGDAVAVESPTYYNMLQTMEVLGLRALELPTDPREGICLSALHEAVRQGAVRACLLHSSFSNPLGCTMPPEKKREVVAMLARHEVPLIEDDIIGDLCHARERPPVMKAFDRKGLVLLCSSYSKTISPGLRVGWIAAGRFQSDVERLKTAVNIATATLPQLVVAEFLANGGYEHHLRGLRRVYAQQAAAMAQAVGGYFPPRTRVSRPAGGFVLWVECPPYVDAFALYGRALEAGMTIAPGPIFSAQGRYRNCIRLNAAYWSEQTAAPLAALGRLAAEMRPRI